jgi:hypothetical protein
MNLTDFVSVGIVIISVISLFVCKFTPLLFNAYWSLPWVGVFLWPQGTQLVSSVTPIRNNLGSF